MREMNPGWSFELERALRWAAVAHDGQVRKSSPVPYIEHPLAVAMILDRAGFPEDVVIAGLLHDVVEDTTATLNDVRARFGDAVAEIVEGCSEVKVDAQGNKRPWADRKRDHLLTLATASIATKAVVLADKLHNLTSIVLDLDEGRPVWSAFNAGRGDVIAYYRSTLAACGSGDVRLETLSRQATALLDRLEPQVENEQPAG
jgi:(p)ppGpp synthase/HD superfamily hydrolase